MKKQKKKIIGIIFMVMMIIFILFCTKKQEANAFQEDLIFFKWFNSNYPSYLFQVSYQNIDFQNIYLADSINPKTLVKEKIAPRNPGDF